MITKKKMANGGLMDSPSTSPEHRVISTDKTPYKYIEIRHSVGKPSVPRTEIAKAIRAVMREDGLLINGDATAQQKSESARASRRNEYAKIKLVRPVGKPSVPEKDIAEAVLSVVKKHKKSLE